MSEIARSLRRVGITADGVIARWEPIIAKEHAKQDGTGTPPSWRELSDTVADMAARLNMAVIASIFRWASSKPSSIKRLQDLTPRGWDAIRDHPEIAIEKFVAIARLQRPQQEEALTRLLAVSSQRKRTWNGRKG